MNGRRGFLKSLVGAFVASAVELRLARELEFGPLGPTAPTAVLTNTMLDAVMAALTAQTREVYVERLRAAYAEAASTPPICLDSRTPA